MARSSCRDRTLRTNLSIELGVKLRPGDSGIPGRSGVDRSLVLRFLEALLAPLLLKRLRMPDAGAF